LIVRSWTLRPRPGRYDDAIGLIAEGAKLAERHGSRNIRLTQAATAGPSTGVLVLTYEFESLAGYGGYLEDTMTDVEAQTHNHRIREARGPVHLRVDGGADGGRSGPGGGERWSWSGSRRPLRPAAAGRWSDTLDITRQAFDLSDRHGPVGCRLFELDHAGERSGMLCAVVEYNSMREFGMAGDAGSPTRRDGR
jgi:hypothetical protein